MRISLNLFLIILLGAVHIACNNTKRVVKEIFWVKVGIDENGNEISELPFKYERYDKKGLLEYDSTLFLSGLGYRVNKYKDNLLISSVAHIDPGIVDSTFNEYDSTGNPIKAIVADDNDRSIIFYKNKYDNKGRVIEIKVYEAGDTVARLKSEHLYSDSLLLAVNTFRYNEITSSFDLLIGKENYYNKDGKIISKVERDFKQTLIDSVAFSHKHLTKKTFRSVRNREYELIRTESVLDSDSTKIEIIDMVNGSKSLLIRKKIEYWP
jgi:hypothetical protein